VQFTERSAFLFDFDERTVRPLTLICCSPFYFLMLPFWYLMPRLCVGIYLKSWYHIMLCIGLKLIIIMKSDRSNSCKNLKKTGDTMTERVHKMLLNINCVRSYMCPAGSKIGGWLLQCSYMMSSMQIASRPTQGLFLGIFSTAHKTASWPNWPNP